MRPTLTKLKTFAGRALRFAEANALVLFLGFCFCICLWISVANELNYRELERQNRDLNVINEALRPKCPCECNLTAPADRP